MRAVVVATALLSKASLRKFGRKIESAGIRNVGEVGLCFGLAEGRRRRVICFSALHI